MAAVSTAVPPATEHRLRGHFPRSMTTVHGKSAIGFGIPFLAAGLFAILAAARIIPTREADFHAPRWVVAVCGLIFAGPGAWLILHGISGCLRTARQTRQRERRPEAPWLADYSWNPSEARDDRNTRLKVRGAQFLMLIIFTLPFNYIGFFTKGALAPRLFMAGTADLVLLIFGGAFVYHVAQRIRFGPSRLKFRRFPFFLGERLDVDFVPSRSFGEVNQLTATLRCIREQYVTTPAPDPRTEIVSQLLHAKSETIAPGRIDCADVFALSFALPDGDFETCLSVQPPRYWEIEIVVDMSGMEFKAVYLVPVYRRPAQSRLPANSVTPPSGVDR
ncbi:MAG: hypothetical protein HUU22_09505 [Phycisphaerae bacterium]|nr:hypothetical protein [Phycisphaerae bacterium]NUQ46257.1 hypothetical protein [Phycisphaerae bacterium]